MAGAIPQKKMLVGDPSLTDLLQEHGRRVSQSINCHHIGTIEDFKPETQTATVSINYKQIKFNLNSNLLVFEPESYDYPVLAEVPVIFLSGGDKTFLNMPVSKGDACILLFNDVDFSNWFVGGLGSDPETLRRHAYSDAIALVGLKNLAGSQQNFDPKAAAIISGDSKNGINTESKKIIISNGKTLGEMLQNLSTQLQDLCDAIGQLTVTAPSSGGPTSTPVNAAKFVEIKTKIGQTAEDLKGLLE